MPLSPHSSSILQSPLIPSRPQIPPIPSPKIKSTLPRPLRRHQLHSSQPSPLITLRPQRHRQPICPLRINHTRLHRKPRLRSQPRPELPDLIPIHIQLHAYRVRRRIAQLQRERHVHVRGDRQIEGCGIPLEPGGRETVERRAGAEG